MNQQISLQNTGTISIFQLQKAQSTKSKEKKRNQSNKKSTKSDIKKKKNQDSNTQKQQTCNSARKSTNSCFNWTKLSITLKKKIFSLLHVNIIQTELIPYIINFGLGCNRKHCLIRNIQYILKSLSSPSYTQMSKYHTPNES